MWRKTYEKLLGRVREESRSGGGLLASAAAARALAQNMKRKVKPNM